MATEGTPLVTPFTLPAPSDISGTEASRFPVDPSSWGVLADVDFGLTIDRLTANFAGALLPEGDHLEPTIGQIWPR
jgi:hypothetical protein